MTIESEKVTSIENAMVRAGLPFRTAFELVGSKYHATNPKDEAQCLGGAITGYLFDPDAQILSLCVSNDGGMALEFAFTGENENWTVVIDDNAPRIVALEFERR